MQKTNLIIFIQLLQKENPSTSEKDHLKKNQQMGLEYIYIFFFFVL